MESEIKKEKFSERARLVRGRSWTVRYGATLLLVAIGAAIDFAFPAFSSKSPFSCFYLLTGIATWFGGFRAGLLATVASLAVVDYYFIPPDGFSTDRDGLIRIILVGFTMVVLSWLIDHRVRDRKEIEDQREQAEDQLHRHHAIVSSASEIAGMGSWEYDIAKDRLQWDDSTCRIFGVTRETFGGNAAAFFTLVHPDDRDALKAMQARALANNGITEMEYRIVRPDGEVRQVYDRGQVTRREEGRAVHSTGMVMDVTAQRQVEKELRESKERYEAAIRGSDAGLWDWNIRNDVIFFSPRYKQLLGFTEQEFPNGKSSFVKVLHPEDRAFVERAFIRHVKDREPFNVEYRLRTKSGEYRWFNARGQAIWDENGRAYRMAGSLVDVTDRLVLEERVRKSQRMEAVGRLAGGVAHDFNNMLGVILGHSLKLEENLPVGTAQWQSVRQIKAAAMRSADLTRQLLAFSRQQILLPRVLDLNATVEDMASMLRSLIGDDIDLAIRLGQKLGHVKADPGQIGQVVMNLVVNARDAMPEGGQIVIATENVVLADHIEPGNLSVVAGAYVMLAVTDNGYGIEPGTLAHIFEPFFTTKEQGKGTGLGLATVYGIVKQSDGYIVAESEPGKGASFKIYLPLAEGQLQVEAAEPEEAVAAGGEETILIAEDEPMLREIVRFQLESAGYNVLEARDGNDALHVAQSHGGKIHLLLTDIVMAGGRNGLELAASLDSMQDGLKVIYMTGYTSELIAQKGMTNLQDRILQKPFTATRLRNKIREVLAAE
jgi:two-component system, cell cycle sensor histidine kinase and response regulator CckA